MLARLAVAAAAASFARADLTGLNFLKTSDTVGFASVFSESDGLPTDAFTISVMCRKNNRKRIATLSADWWILEMYDNSIHKSDFMCAGEGAPACSWMLTLMSGAQDGLHVPRL